MSQISFKTSRRIEIYLPITLLRSFNNNYFFIFLLLLGFYFSDRYCWENAIGLETGEVPDINITASSYIDSNPPSAARLGFHVGWCPKKVVNAFLQIDLGVPYRLPAVAIQGRSDGSFVKRYAIMLSLDGGNWTEFEKVECN